MALPSLTFKEIKARPVICKLTRPAVLVPVTTDNVYRNKTIAGPVS
jgi:hypothetical protein